MEIASIEHATTEDDLTKVGRFRYRIYVEEMKRFQQYADHAARTVCEPLDRSGHVLIALQGSEVVGTVRFNLGSESDLGLYTELYRLKELGPLFPKRVSITTKLMIAPEYRRTPLALRLALASYKYASVRGVDVDAIDCNPPLKSFFAKLGYRQVFGAIDHPEYGHVIPMFLAVRDKQHLQQVRSPFLKLAESLDHDWESADLLNALAELYQPSSTQPVVSKAVVNDGPRPERSLEIFRESENS